MIIFFHILPAKTADIIREPTRDVTGFSGPVKQLKQNQDETSNVQTKYTMNNKSNSKFVKTYKFGYIFQ